MSNYWITKEEYEDGGNQIIYRKCQNIIYWTKKLILNLNFI
jgi:hypothetical protein